jgi:hypothetical protein
MEVMEYGLQAQQPGDYLPLAFTFGQSLIPKPSTPTNGHLPWPADDHSSSTANATSNADSLIEPDNQTITRKRRSGSSGYTSAVSWSWVRCLIHSSESNHVCVIKLAPCTEVSMFTPRWKAPLHRGRTLNKNLGSTTS